ncbi:MAG: hypothetical protein LBH16_11040 [Treponema sp.]|jgi:hypothetical protein|nr:hypothetical protein [Treponema sp.]
MKRSSFALVLTLIFAAFASLAAQENALPHVTQIKAEARNNFIRLTWADSPDARGSVFIFRSTRPFAASIPPNIRPVTVRYGEQYYIDDTEDIENLYYFIAASDSAGRRYDIIIPQTNSTNVNISGAAQPAESSAANTASVVESAPSGPSISLIQGISNIRTRLDGERIIITYDAPVPRKNVVLYRGMQPIRQPHDLLNAVIVRSGIETSFTDIPVAEVTWYYALIYEEEISGGSMGIKPGINATISAVTITSAGTAERTLRPIPLPVLSRNVMPDGFFLNSIQRPQPLSEASSVMLRNTQMPPKVPLVLKTPRIFTVDMQSPSSGEESALFQVVNEYFEKKDWEEARSGLLLYLSLPRSRDAEARARFYLGQTLYFTGKYKDALFEFLAIKSIHPEEAASWVDAVLEAMVY